MKIKGIAHRGDPVNFPENTLSAFQAACDQDFTHVELDVHLSKDGIPVIIHDTTLERMTNGKGLIKDYTVEELKQLKVAETESIPTLEEALNLLKGKISVVVELKQQGNLYPTMEEKVLAVVEKTNMLEHVRIISFDHFSVNKVRKLHPSIKLGLCSSGSIPSVFDFMKEIQCDFLAPNFRFLTPAYAEMMLENGVIINPWPIDTVRDMQVIAEQYPTAFVTTNQLERWAEFYSNRKDLQLV